MSRKPNSNSRSYRRSISFTAQPSALAAFLGLVTGWVRRWGRRLYWPISTCLGSTRMRRTWSGVVRMSSDVMMQLMPLDLPAPVAPAMSRWGVVARLRNTARPAMSLPMATSSGCVAWRASVEARMSPSETSWRVWLGTSMPMAERPGIGARMRTSVAAMA